MLLVILEFPFYLYSEEEQLWTFSLQADVTDLSYYLEDNSNLLDFSQNNGVITRVGIQYKNFGIKIGFGWGRQDPVYDVNTTAIDIQSFLYFEKWGTDIYYQDYTGYYIDEEPISNIIYYPDMETQTKTVNIYYKISGNRGLSAFTTPTRKDRDFSYLFYTMGSVSHRSIHSDRSVIPESKITEMQYFANMERIDFIIPSLSFGFLLSLRLNQIYIDPCLSIGLGIPFTDSNVDINADYSIKVNMKASIGYEGEKVGFGMNIIGDSDAIEFTDLQSIQFFSILVSTFINIKF